MRLMKFPRSGTKLPAIDKASDCSNTSPIHDTDITVLADLATNSDLSRRQLNCCWLNGSPAHQHEVRISSFIMMLDHYSS